MKKKKKSFGNTKSVKINDILYVICSWIGGGQKSPKKIFFFFLASPEAVTACTTLCVLVMLLMGRYVSTEQTG